MKKSTTLEIGLEKGCQGSKLGDLPFVWRFWPLNRFWRSRLDPPDRVTTSEIGAATGIGAGKLVVRPNTQTTKERQDFAASVRVCPLLHKMVPQLKWASNFERVFFICQGGSARGVAVVCFQMFKGFGRTSSFGMILFHLSLHLGCSKFYDQWKSSFLN